MGGSTAVRFVRTVSLAVLIPNPHEQKLAHPLTCRSDTQCVGFCLPHRHGRDVLLKQPTFGEVQHTMSSYGHTHTAIFPAVRI